METNDELADMIEQDLLEPLADRAERDQRRTLEQLAAADITPREALDYYMVVLGPYSASEWADCRNVSPQAVWEAAENAREVLLESGHPLAREKDND